LRWCVFATSRPLEGRLLDGPILDFNAMVRRDTATASASVALLVDFRRRE